MKQISEFSILTIKDIKTLLNVQDNRTAKKYLDDIKEAYHLNKVLYYHFKCYFKVT